MRALPHSRYECKYLVDAALVPAIRRCLQPFMRPDPHAAAAGGIYTISSLYLDAPDLRLLRMGQEGWSERLKLRARTYSDHPSAPVYLEIKRRHSGVVHKQRAPVSRTVARALLARQHSSAAGSHDPATAAFRAAVLSCDARPVALVRYQREAHEARGAGSVRVTFDTRIECASEAGVEFGATPERWRSAGLDGVVLELKFTDTYPPWVQALLARFELERRSISKYTHAMESLSAPARGFAARESRPCAT